MRTVTVTGTGTSRVAPDSAVVRLAAVGRGSGVSEAYDSMAAAAAAVAEIARRHTEERRTASTGITVWPTRDHEGREVELGYAVTPAARGRGVATAALLAMARWAFAEAGLPYGDAGSWQGIMTTAGSPPELVARLNAALADILKRPEMADRIKQQGGRVVGGSPAELGTWLADSIRTWGKVVAEAGIKAE